MGRPDGSEDEIFRAQHGPYGNRSLAIAVSTDPALVLPYICDNDHFRSATCSGICPNGNYREGHGAPKGATSLCHGLAERLQIDQLGYRGMTGLHRKARLKILSAIGRRGSADLRSFRL